MEWRFNSTCDHPGSGDNSQDLTCKTIRKKMGGVEKKTKQGKVTEKINCANPKDNHGIKFIKNQCAINSYSSLLDSFAIKQAHTVF